jgi:hypothetical protein
MQETYARTRWGPKSVSKSGAQRQAVFRKGRKTKMGYVPEWLQGVINTMQGKADAKYRDEVASYEAAAQDWIKAMQINQADHLAIVPFTKPAPQRVVFAADENNNLTQTLAPVEVQAPVLPPYVEPPAGIPFEQWVNPGRAAQQNQDDLLSAIFAKVSAIAVKVGA